MKSAIATAVAVMLLVSCVTVKPPTYVSSGPGWYTVKRSDTLYSIAWRYGLDYKQLARWNQIDVNSPIHPGQRLRLIKPGNQTIAGSGAQNRAAKLKLKPKLKLKLKPKPKPVSPRPATMISTASVARLNGSGRRKVNR